MRTAHLFPRLAAIVVLLSISSPARGEPIPWSYQWSATPGTVTSHQGGAGVVFTPLDGGPLSGSATVVAAQLEPTLAARHAQGFGHRPYGLTLLLTDETSGESGTLDFGGWLTGVVGPNHVQIVNHFKKPPTGSITLGGNTYTVALGGFLGPGELGSGVKGHIEATISVGGSGGSVIHAAEPSALLLAGLGLSAVGLRRWARRARRD
jgi:hypothetical protein